MPGILINIPVEIDAGSFATALQVQGETVSYSKVNVPLQYVTVGGDVVVEQDPISVHTS